MGRCHLLNGIPDEVRARWRAEREEHDKRMAEWESLSEAEQKARWDAQTKALAAENHRRAMIKICGKVEPLAPSNESEQIAGELCSLVFETLEKPLIDPCNIIPQYHRMFSHIGSLMRQDEYEYPKCGTEAYCVLWGNRLVGLAWIWNLQDEILAEHNVEYMRGDNYLGLDSHRRQMLDAIGDDHCYRTKGAARVFHYDNIPVGCSEVHDGFYFHESHGKARATKITKKVKFFYEWVFHYPNRDIWAEMWEHFVTKRVGSGRAKGLRYGKSGAGGVSFMESV